MPSDPLVSSSSFVCPRSQDITPCLCRPNKEDDAAILFCEVSNLDDYKASRILDAFIAKPPGSNKNYPLGAIFFSKNRLTRIPDQLRLFNRLINVELDKNNISSIEPSAFNNCNKII